MNPHPSRNTNRPDTRGQPTRNPADRITTRPAAPERAGRRRPPKHPLYFPQHPATTKTRRVLLIPIPSCRLLYGAGGLQGGLVLLPLESGGAAGDVLVLLRPIGVDSGRAQRP